MMENRQAHWDHVYETKAVTELSWYQENPAISLDLIQATGVKQDGAIISTSAAALRGLWTLYWPKAFVI
jgi:hypothetical protein